MFPAVAVPADLLQRILLESDYPTIRSVAEASRLFSMVARPILWDHVFIDNKRNSPVPSTVLSLIRSLTLTAFPQGCLMYSLSGMSSLEELVLDCSMDAGSWETLLSFLGPEKLRRLSISNASAPLLKESVLMRRLGNLCCRQMDYLQIESSTNLDHLPVFISRLQPQSLLVNTPRIPQLNRLRCLDVSNTNILPNDLYNLPSTIRDLSIINCPNIDAATLSNFGTHSQIRLRSLEFSLGSFSSQNEHGNEVSFLELPAFSGITDLLAQGSQFQNAHLEKAALALPVLERIILDRVYVNAMGLSRALGAHRACKEVILISNAKVTKEPLVDFLEKSGTTVECVIALGCSRLSKFTIDKTTNQQRPNEIILYSTLSSHQTISAHMTFATSFDHFLRPFARHVAQCTRLPSWRLRGFLRRHDLIQREDDGISRRRHGPSVHGPSVHGSGGGRVIEEERRITRVIEEERRITTAVTAASSSSSPSLMQDVEQQSYEKLSPDIQRVVTQLLEQAQRMLVTKSSVEDENQRKLRHEILATMSARAHARSLSSLPWNERIFGVRPEDVMTPEPLKLGEGGYKVQVRGIYRMNKTEIPVAVGITKDPIISIGHYAAFMEEIDAAQRFDHSGIVRTYGGYIREQDNKGVIISELADMNLWDYIKIKSDPGPYIKLEMIRQLLTSIEYLHTVPRLVHGDLKLRNIIVFSPAGSSHFEANTTMNTTSTVLISNNHPGSPPASPSAQPRSPTNIPSITTTLPMTATAAAETSSINFGVSQLSSPISHRRRPGYFSTPVPIIKIVDFSTLAPISTQYGAPDSLIQHAEHYHRHGTFMVRPPEASEMSPPMPSSDIYALGILFYNIIVWSPCAPEPFASLSGSQLDRHFRNNGGMPDFSLARRFIGTFGESILNGMVEPSVDRRWDLEKVRAGWDEFEVRLKEQLERASIVNM